MLCRPWGDGAAGDFWASKAPSRGRAEGPGPLSSAERREVMSAVETKAPGTFTRGVREKFSDEKARRPQGGLDARASRRIAWSSGTTSSAMP